ncbi:MAG: aldehyde dehydrogenase, partial [Proteobacteria bacterium]
MESINPHSGKPIHYYESETDEIVRQRLQAAADAFQAWKSTTFPARAQRMHAAAGLLRERKAALAELMADEM